MQKKKQNKTKQRKQQQQQQKPWEYTHYENIILLITGFHRAVGWAVGTSPYNIVL